MRQAIELHGVPKGIWLGTMRLGKCHPFHKGGVDPVPEPRQTEPLHLASRTSNKNLRQTY